jgi:hypothetical protein
MNRELGLELADPPPCRPKLLALLPKGRPGRLQCRRFRAGVEGVFRFGPLSWPFTELATEVKEVWQLEL